MAAMPGRPCWPRGVTPLRRSRTTNRRARSAALRNRCWVSSRPERRRGAAAVKWRWWFCGHGDVRDYADGVEAVARVNARPFALYDALAADGLALEMHRQGLLYLFRQIGDAEAELHELQRTERFGYT